MYFLLVEAGLEQYFSETQVQKLPGGVCQVAQIALQNTNMPEGTEPVAKFCL